MRCTSRCLTPIHQDGTIKRARRATVQKNATWCMIRASELVLLNIWNLLRSHIGKGSKSTNRAITAVLLYAIQLHLAIATELLERKVLPHVGARDAISMAVQTRSSVDVNL